MDGGKKRSDLLMATYVGPFNLIIPVAAKQNSMEVFAVLDPDTGGAAPLRVRLSANGQEPVTHWGAQTLLEPATVNALQSMSVSEFKEYVDQVAAVRGRTPVGSVTAFKNSLVMGEGNFWSFIAAQGLQLVPEPE